jgi:hypothetical protein
MRRRLLLVLCVLVMLAFASVAAGSGVGAKYKVKMDGLAFSCGFSCSQFDKHPDSFVIKRLDDNRTSCMPLVDFFSCKWTARAGTKLVLEARVPDTDPPIQVDWSGDCAPSQGNKCVLIMDSNKEFDVIYEGP